MTEQEFREWLNRFNFKFSLSEEEIKEIYFKLKQERFDRESIEPEAIIALQGDSPNIQQNELDINQIVDIYDRTIVSYIGLSGNLDAIQWALQQPKVNISQLDIFGRSFWHYIARSGNLVAIQWAIQQEPNNVNHTDLLGLNFWHHIALSGKSEAIQWATQQEDFYNQNDQNVQSFINCIIRCSNHYEDSSFIKIILTNYIHHSGYDSEFFNNLWNSLSEELRQILKIIYRFFRYCIINDQTSRFKIWSRNRNRITITQEAFETDPTLFTEFLIRFIQGFHFKELTQKQRTERIQFLFSFFCDHLENITENPMIAPEQFIDLLDVFYERVTTNFYKLVYQTHIIRLISHLIRINNKLDEKHQAKNRELICFITLHHLLNRIGLDIHDLASIKQDSQDFENREAYRLLDNVINYLISSDKGIARNINNIDNQIESHELSLSGMWEKTQREDSRTLLRLELKLSNLLTVMNQSFLNSIEKSQCQIIYKILRKLNLEKTDQATIQENFTSIIESISRDKHNGLKSEIIIS